MKVKNHKAFTLVEVLLVIVIIAILAGIVLIAINPQRQIQQANNAERDAGVQSILNAVSEYAIENRGAFPAGITTAPLVVGSGTGELDLCADLTPVFIAEMPVDPVSGSWTDCNTYSTGYTILDAGSNRITVAAPGAELSEVISVTR